jgi:hypothetical protein
MVTCDVIVTCDVWRIDTYPNSTVTLSMDP